MADKERNPVPIPLTGRWRTSVDGTQLSEGDFQVLTNMRYTNAGIRSVSGMTKINTTVTALNSYLLFRAGHHFTKDEPTESHVLIQAWDSGETASKIYRNDTAIPSQGNFNSTALYTESTGAGIGTFSNAPDGCVAYCNGKESLIWGGDEYRCGAFFNFNPDNSFVYNYSEAVSNTLQSTGNTALLKRVSATLDSNTMLLLHFDGNFTDSSPTTPHTITGNGSIATDTGTKKFGTASCKFATGGGQYLTIPDDVDFVLSDGTWAIDMWVYFSDVGTTQTLYYQQTDINNCMAVYLTGGALGNIRMEIVAATVVVVEVYTAYEITINQWYHIEVVENGDNFYIFIDGIQRAYTSDTSRAVDYTGLIYIGRNPNQTIYDLGVTSNAWLDEFRVSNNARHTANFLPPQGAYGNNTITYVYIGSTRPLAGIKFYIKTANATASPDATVSYWDGTSWTTAGSITDGTVSSGKALAVTGSLAFTSTVSTAKPKILYNIAAYWYLVAWTSIDQNAEIYYTTLDTPMQPIVDIWDGIKRQAYAFFKYVGTTYTDHIFNIIGDTYIDADTTTYVELDSLATSSYVLAGFAEPMMGVQLHLVPGHVNTTANTLVTVSYWSGSAWVSVGTVDDGTKGTSQSLNKSGNITWQAIAKGTEQTTTISTNDTPLYYYKLAFSQALSADVQLYYVGGIPAQKQISNYKFPVSFHNRLWLCSDQSGQRNKITPSGTSTVSVFNGSDTADFFLGDNTDIIAGGSLYTRFGSSLYENLILCKEQETWLIDGTSLNTYALYKISDQYGCVAKDTFKICNIGFEIAQGINKHVAIWQAAGAIVIFDGSSVMPIHVDIENVFDPTSSTTINTAKIHKSTAFYDEAKREYHWLWASGSNTTLNKEYVFDLMRRKWFEIDRSTGEYLQLGIPVTDSNGYKYVYGAIDTGYLERLEYGTTFDGNNIVSQFQTPDIPLGGWNNETMLRIVRMIAKSKATTVNSIAMTHYGDMANTGTSIGSFSVTDTTHRVVNNMKSINTGPHTFHSFACSMTTSNENVGFEPIGLEVFWKHVREKIL
ncbi:MAG TPA: LamG domain-containing protein [Candidatus Brocadiaceae bacterium]|nr:LamG domain-containing protein [Candidatus Brocadiaceae bacterium]